MINTSSITHALLLSTLLTHVCVHRTVIGVNIYAGHY
jgi:hypothetical protein